MPRRDVYIETFGCQMNELDSELVTGQLRALGYRLTPDPEAAGIILYNTCSVREHAEQKVWSRLGELARRKVDQPGLVVGVLGCMAERDGKDLIRRMPVVDILCGPGELDKLPGLLDNAVRTRISLEDGLDAELAAERSAGQVALQGSSSRRSSTLAAAADSLEMLDLSRAISPIDADPEPGTPRASAYVRITRGCNKFCTYCVVPFTRGAEVHRPPDHIVEECKRLADSGVIEITLLGQTVNHYRFEHGAAVVVDGVTQPQKGRSYAGGHRRDPFAGTGVTTFADLLRRIHDEVPAIRRLRFVTSYPRDFGDDVLEVIRDHPRICRYLHVPAQSGSDRILKLMNRGYEVAEYLEFLDRARSFLDQPEINRPLTVSGDIIVGFPTETDDDYAATVALVERARYKNCFIFKYSPRPGTIAFDKLADDVPESVKRRRNNDLLAIQGRISDGLSQAQVGKTLDVLVEGLSRREQKRAAKPGGACGAGGAGGPGTTSLTLNGKGLSDHGGSACAIDAEETEAELPSGPPGTVQLSARTDGDLIVFFDAPAVAAALLIGRVVPVRIDSASGLALHGSPADPAYTAAAV
ncbi:MAG: MiaB/RimO family radical SAM methylthiotransferase [Phycisphaerales bacterium]|nr:MiaB/RimO family radical SAM methylthiotransferase [Phycisphaerales bacterium]